MALTNIEVETMSIIKSACRKYVNETDELTIRDKFAMAALATLSGGSWNGTPCHMIYDNKYHIDDKLAVSAYKIADAMIKARNS